MSPRISQIALATGDGHYQGTKRLWPKVVAKAELSGITPHTLRHTMGSTAVSTGEAMALTGAILGHANARSTALYAHVQNDPSRRAADRVSKKIAAALSGCIPDRLRPAPASDAVGHPPAKKDTENVF